MDKFTPPVTPALFISSNLSLEPLEKSAFGSFTTEVAFLAFIQGFVWEVCSQEGIIDVCALVEMLQYRLGVVGRFSVRLFLESLEGFRPGECDCMLLCRGKIRGDIHQLRMKTDRPVEVRGRPQVTLRTRKNPHRPRTIVWQSHHLEDNRPKRTPHPCPYRRIEQLTVGRFASVLFLLPYLITRVDTC